MQIQDLKFCLALSLFHYKKQVRDVIGLCEVATSVHVAKISSPEG